MRHMGRQVGWRWLLALCALWLAGCAQPPQIQGTDQEDAWSGRLALQVEGQAAQSFAALFELRGNAQAGELVLISPLGNRVAQLDWKDGYAQLISGQGERRSESLDSLLQELTGTPIPVAAMFQWLKGVHTSALGWSADLSGLPDGRLVARRDTPTAPATLRIALTR